MIRYLLFALFTAVTTGQAQYKYPNTKTVNTTDVYWNTTLADPYRWLEDLKNPEVEQWFKSQADYTTNLLDKIPGKDALIQEWKTLYAENPVSYSSIRKVGQAYFYQKMLSGEPVAKIYMRDKKTGTETLLFDPMAFSPEKPIETAFSVSDDAAALLLKISEEGKEVSDFRILDIKTKKILPDVLPHSMFADFVAGSHDKILYFQLKNYDVHDAENAINPKTLLHEIGTEVSTDKVILSAEKYPELLDAVGWSVIKTYKDCPYIFVEKSTSSNYKQVYYAPARELGSPKINWKPFCKPEDEIWKLLIVENQAYCITSKGNPYFRILKVSLSDPDLASAPEIFSGSQDWKLAVYGETIDTYRAADDLVLNLSKNELEFKTLLYHFKSGKTTTLKTPLQGNCTAIPMSENDTELRIVNYSWVLPNTQYIYDTASGSFTDGPFHVKSKYPGLENLVFEQKEVTSHDGVLVPISIIYDKNTFKKDGANITLLTGYGAYGMTNSPSFNLGILPFLKRGGIYAIAHVRGGGEKGNDWHMDGKKSKKPNTWKDFNACADYLIREGYTKSERLACSSGSAGGIMIGRAITERPQLYKVAIPKVGVMNVLRFMAGPNAQGNFDEYGNLENQEEFKALVEMDAMYHIKKKTRYPAQLITTGYNDPRVPSSLVGKYAAAMQAANNPEIPTLLYVDYTAGHFSGSFEQFVKQSADEYAFLLWQCGHPDFQPKK